MEDEIIDPGTVGFVDSNMDGDGPDESESGEDELDECGDAPVSGTATLTLDFEGDGPACREFMNVIDAFGRGKSLKPRLDRPKSRIIVSAPASDLESLRDVYAMFNGFDCADDMEDCPPAVPFEDVVVYSAEEPSSVGRECSIPLEVRRSDVSDFRKAVKAECPGAVTSLCESMGRGPDGMSAFIQIRGPLDAVKKAFALWTGAAAFDRMTPGEMGEFDSLAEFDDGDCLDEADFRERISHDLDPIGVKASTANLRARDDARGISLAEDESDDDLNPVAAAVEQAALDGQDQIIGKFGSKIFANKTEEEDFLDLNDGTEKGYDRQEAFLDKKLRSAGSDDERFAVQTLKRNVESAHAAYIEKTLRGVSGGKSPDHGFFGKSDLSVLSHATGEYVDAKGQKKTINGDVLTKFQWMQYDELLKLRHEGKAFTPSQQALWDKLVDQVNSAKFSTTWQIWAPENTRQNAVRRGGQGDDETGPREYGTTGGDEDDPDDLGTGYAKSNYDDISFSNKEYQKYADREVDREDVYTGPIPVNINPDDSYERHGHAEIVKNLNNINKNVYRGEARKLASELRGKDTWALDEWNRIMAGLTREERDEMYDDLIKQAQKAAKRADGDAVGGGDEAGFIDKIFHKIQFIAGRVGGTEKNAKDMTAADLKKANVLRTQATREFNAFFMTLRNAIDKMSQKHSNDTVLKMLSVMFHRLAVIRKWSKDEWQKYALSTILNNRWVRDGWDPELVDKSKYMQNGQPIIDKKTGEPKLPVVPTQKAVFNNTFFNLVEVLLNHLMRQKDTELVDEFGELVKNKQSANSWRTHGTDKSEEDV